MSEYKIISNDATNLIICFGGMSLLMGGIPPFEFLNQLSKTYTTDTDKYFYIDKNQCWYHKGIYGITKNIDDTVVYLNNIIHNKKYKKVIFMGVSAGGYASILFGSLCNISNVISFIPCTKYHNKMIDPRYYNLCTVINNKTEYILYGDTNVKNINDTHHISQCENLNKYNNVKIIYHTDICMKKLRDNNTIKTLLDNILNL